MLNIILWCVILIVSSEAKQRFSVTIAIREESADFTYRATPGNKFETKAKDNFISAICPTSSRSGMKI